MSTRENGREWGNHRGAYPASWGEAGSPAGRPSRPNPTAHLTGVPKGTVLIRSSLPGESPGFSHPETPRSARGRHAAPTRSWLKSRSRFLLPISVLAAVLIGGVAAASPLVNAINYKVVAPVTVQALGMDDDTPAVGQNVRAGAKVVAERAQTFDQVALVVRDQSGAKFDYPAIRDWSLGTSQKEFTSSRTFDHAGRYTYWFAYASGGKWTHLSPKRHFTVGGPDAGSPTPSPSASSSAEPTPTTSPTSSPTGPTPAPTTSPTSSPSPTPTGTNGRACPAWPAVPDASCTGVPPGITLRSCSNYLSTAGATYDGCLFSGQVTVAASNITIKNSKVVAGRINAGYGSQTGLMIMDVEIDGQNKDQTNQSAIGDSNYTCIRCNVHNTGRGVAVGSNVTIRDSWFHDFYYTNGAHQSAIGSNGGSNNSVIHNNINCNSDGCSGALVFYGDFAPIQNVLVQNNLMNTTGSYCTYGGSVSGKPYPVASNIRYIDNRFGKVYHPSCGIYGPVATWSYANGNVWSGNTWADGSGTVSP